MLRRGSKHETLSVLGSLCKFWSNTQHSQQIRWVTDTKRVQSAAAAGKHVSKRVKYDPLPPGWQAIIGVEVHAQLKAKEKLFSSARADAPLTEPGNLHVAPFDAALPGSLPSLQSDSLDLALRACLALECRVAEKMTFDRKHYFYPDLPSGYQVTQKYAPLAKDGKLRLLFDDGHLSNPKEEVTVQIEQIQLEQDTAKSSHYSDHTYSHHTLVDLNRAGSALIEIVSGPDMRTAEQAGAYVRKLRETVRRIGVSDGNMDQGSLRCDVNVSVHREGEPWGVRCEVKNLNSIRFIMNAIGYEIHRQYNLLSSKEIVSQETRGYDEATGATFKLRSKEDSPDYRYMPDPNLAPVHITSEMLRSIKEDLPELMEQQRKRLVEQYQIPLRDANVLIRIGLEEENIKVDPVAYFEQVSQGRDARVALNWIIQTLLRILNGQEKTFADNTIEATHLGQLIDLVEAGKVTSSTARSLLKNLLSENGSHILQPHLASSNPVLSLLSSRDALAFDSNNDLAVLCQEVVRDLPKEAEKVRKGNEKVVMRLIGEVMKRAKGRADAQLAREIFLDLLK